jgi:cation diffusion facilitator CzcD-associated flavoprotein CzcO
MLQVCIIGAGPSGLVACKELRVRGLQCRIFEQQGTLGGAFARAYEGFRFTTSTHLSAFSDCPESPPSRHWTAAEFVQYCERYVQRFDLLDCIVLDATVTRVRRLEQGFAVTVKRAQNDTIEQRFDRIVICSGLNHAPKPEQIHPHAVHSSAIRNLLPFAEKRVLIVGGGESGTDLSLLLMQHGAKAVCISVRSAATQGWMVARTYGRSSIPSDVDTSWVLHQMNHRFKAFFFEHISPLVSWLRFRVNVWRRRREGTLFWNPNLTQSRWNAGKTIDTTFGVKTNSLITAIRMGACLAPGIDRIEDGTAVFVDGKTFAYDCIVNCTGYQTDFWFLDSSADREELSRSDRLFWHMISPRVNDIALVGFLRPSFGVLITVSELQARYLAQLWSGEKTLPHNVDEQIQMQLQSRYERYGRIAEQIPALEEFLPSLEGLAQLVGCRPSLAKYFFCDWKLWFHLLFGPLIAARYRLEGPDANFDEACRTLMSYSWSDGYIGTLSLYAFIPSVLSWIVDCVTAWF